MGRGQASLERRLEARPGISHGMPSPDPRPQPRPARLTRRELAIALGRDRGPSLALVAIWAGVAAVLVALWRWG